MDYFLTDEPWIPCEGLDGKVVELGLTDLFSQAHELKALTDPSPPVTIALHRLLIAIIHRCFGPASLGEWGDLYRTGRFDAGRTTEYLHRWRHRFNLLDPKRPFYQVPGMPYEPKPACELLLERSRHGSEMLFEHRPSRDHDRIPIGVAARSLVAAQAYRVGGLVARSAGEPPSSAAAPLVAGAVTLLRGENLWETLTLNTLVYAPGGSAPIPSLERDAPAWESDLEARPGKRTPNGWLDLLTWQSRRIALIPVGNERQVIERVIIAGGCDLLSQILDPMMAYRADPKRGMVAIRIEAERAVWRDSHVLLQAANAEHAARRARTLDQLVRDELVDLVPTARRFHLDIGGIRTDQAKILLARLECLPVSAQVLADPESGSAIEEALQHSEMVASALRKAVWVLARYAISSGDREPAADDVRALVDSLGVAPKYWGALGPSFNEFMAGLVSGDDQSLDRFLSEVRRTAHGVFADARRSLGAIARVLKGGSQGEALLLRELGKTTRKEVV